MFHLKRNFLLFGSILSIFLSASEGGNIRVDLDVLLSCYYFSFSGANERKDVVCLHLQHEKKRLVSFLPLPLSTSCPSPSSSSSSSMSLTLFYAASSCASLTIDIDESILNCARVSSIVGQMAAHSNQSGSNRNFVSLLRRIRIRRRRRLLLLLLLLRFCFIFYLVNVDFNHRRQKIAQ